MMRGVLHLMVVCVGCASTDAPEETRGTSLAAPDWDGSGTGGTDGCADWAPEFGEWGGAVSPGALTRTPYDFDAGVGAALEAAPATGEITGLEIPITDAVVVNVGAPRSGGSNIWFADGSGALRTYGVSGTEGVAPGDRVSMVITAIDSYGGELQVTQAEALSISDADEPVYVVDQTSGAVNYPNHGRQNIFGWGEVQSEPVSCGGSSVCVELVASGQTFTVRIGESQAPELDSCLAVLAPLGTYNQGLQLNIDNYDWRVEF